MGNNREAKRDALRERLITAAATLIEKHGLRGLKARDITARADCALGALYNAVEDLDQLVILVNARSLRRLGQTLRDVVPDAATPHDTLHALAQGYVAFALEYEALWLAIFHHELPIGADVPGWQNTEYTVLIEQIMAPLSALRPDLERDALRQRAQTLFGAVHGVVQLSIVGFNVGAPQDRLPGEVAALVDAIISGLPLDKKIMA